MDQEETREPDMMCKPCMPSQAEVDLHNATHWPFRSWCPICVMGRGQEAPHRTKEDHSTNGVHIVTMDYGYLREHKHSAREPPRPILVEVDREHKWVFADMVPNKEN